MPAWLSGLSGCAGLGAPCTLARRARRAPSRCPASACGSRTGCSWTQRASAPRTPASRTAPQGTPAGWGTPATLEVSYRALRASTASQHRWQKTLSHTTLAWLSRATRCRRTSSAGGMRQQTATRPTRATRPRRATRRPPRRLTCRASRPVPSSWPALPTARSSSATRAGRAFCHWSAARQTPRTTGWSPAQSSTRPVARWRFLGGCSLKWAPDSLDPMYTWSLVPSNDMDADTQLDTFWIVSGSLSACPGQMLYLDGAGCSPVLKPFDGSTSARWMLVSANSTTQGWITSTSDSACPSMMLALEAYRLRSDHFVRAPMGLWSVLPLDTTPWPHRSSVLLVEGQASCDEEAVPAALPGMTNPATCCRRKGVERALDLTLTLGTHSTSPGQLTVCWGLSAEEGRFQGAAPPPAAEQHLVKVGSLVLHGPELLGSISCVLGALCTVSLSGLGLSALDSLVLHSGADCLWALAPPFGPAAECAADGSDAYVSASIVSYERLIVSTTCAGLAGVASGALAKLATYAVPTSIRLLPELSAYTLPDHGPVGVALDGIAMWAGSAPADDSVHSNASNGTGRACNIAINDEGEAFYSGAPDAGACPHVAGWAASLDLESFNLTGDGQPPLLGFMMDGVPLFGPLEGDNSTSRNFTADACGGYAADSVLPFYRYHAAAAGVLPPCIRGVVSAGRGFVVLPAPIGGTAGASQVQDLSQLLPEWEMGERTALLRHAALAQTFPAASATGDATGASVDIGRTPPLATREHTVCWGRGLVLDDHRTPLGSLRLLGPATAAFRCALSLPCGLLLEGEGLDALNGSGLLRLSPDQSCGQTAAPEGFVLPAVSAAVDASQAYHLGTPRAGAVGEEAYTVCWTAPEGDAEPVPVGRLELAGPANPWQSFACESQRVCSVALSQHVAGWDVADARLAAHFGSDCGGAAVATSEGRSGGVYDFGAFPEGATVGHYALCWRLAEAAVEDAVLVGELVVSGPGEIGHVPNVLVAGEAFDLEVWGSGLQDNDSIRIISASIPCGAEGSANHTDLLRFPQVDPNATYTETLTSSTKTLTSTSSTTGTSTTLTSTTGTSTTLTSTTGTSTTLTSSSRTSSSTVTTTSGTSSTSASSTTETSSTSASTTTATSSTTATTISGTSTSSATSSTQTSSTTRSTASGTSTTSQTSTSDTFTITSSTSTDSSSTTPSSTTLSSSTESSGTYSSSTTGSSGTTTSTITTVTITTQTTTTTGVSITGTSFTTPTSTTMTSSATASTTTLTTTTGTSSTTRSSSTTLSTTTGSSTTDSSTTTVSTTTVTSFWGTYVILPGLTLVRGGNFSVCWCPGESGDECSEDFSFRVAAGSYIVKGPESVEAIPPPYPGLQFSIVISGRRLSEEDRIRVVAASTAAGEKCTGDDNQHTAALLGPLAADPDATSTVYDFGDAAHWPNTSFTRAGLFDICWCPAPCNNLTLRPFAVHAGTFVVSGALDVSGADGMAPVPLAGVPMQVQTTGIGLTMQDLLKVVPAGPLGCAEPPRPGLIGGALASGEGLPDTGGGSWSNWTFQALLPGEVLICWRAPGESAAWVELAAVDVLGPARAALGEQVAGVPLGWAVAGAPFSLQLTSAGGGGVPEAGAVEAWLLNASGPPCGEGSAASGAIARLYEDDALHWSNGTTWPSVLVDAPGDVRVCAALRAGCGAGGACAGGHAAGLGSAYEVALVELRIGGPQELELQESAAVAGVPFVLTLAGTLLGSADRVQVRAASEPCGTGLDPVAEGFARGEVLPNATGESGAAGDNLTWMRLDFEVSAVALGGPHRVCWCSGARDCSNSSSFRVDAGEFVATGPAGGAAVTCVRAGPCALTLSGPGAFQDLVAEVALRTSCEDSDGGFVANVSVAEDALLVQWDRLYVAVGSYEVCWTVLEGGSSGVAGGTVLVIGPHLGTSWGCVGGRSCGVLGIEGVGLLADDLLVVREAPCGVYDHDLGDGRRFQGSTDADTQVLVQFAAPVVARYVRLWPTAWHGHVALRAGLWLPVCDGCASSTVVDAAPELRDASSVNESGGPADCFDCGRLDSSSAWVAQHSALGEWYQIDATKVMPIGGIALRGRGDRPQWVTEFIVSYSTDGASWATLHEANSVVGFPNGGVTEASRSAGAAASEWVWPGSIEANGGLYYLCWHPAQAPEAPYPGLKQFWTPLGSLELDGPEGGQEFGCTVFRPCRLGGLRGQGLRAGDLLRPMLNCAAEFQSAAASATGNGSEFDWGMGIALLLAG
ncbi:unnamed protein product, partial [Prorocentrum cordatum]